MRDNPRNTVDKTPGRVADHRAVAGRVLFPSPDGLDVISWSPGEPGTRATQVHILLPVGDDMTLAFRFKSRAAIQALIDALANHRDHVWEP